MLRNTLLAAAAALLAAPALAQPLEVELEGTITDYNATTSVLTLMGTQVYVPPTAVVFSPTTERTEINHTLNGWFRGFSFPGRTRAGMLGGTGIVIGTWDEATNRIIADEVFTEPAENVVLGSVTANWCTTPNCDGAGDYLRGNSSPTGGAGPAFLPLRDRRITAGPVRDETLFPLNLTGANLRGFGFGAEGYFGTSPVTVPTTTGGTASEMAFHYFIWDLVVPAPQLYLNKDRRELSVLRTRCNVGDRFEVRGYNHTTVNAAGVDNDTLNANSGVISVQFTNAAGQLVRQNGTATPIAGVGAVGQFRIRFDTNFCPETYTLRWLPAANSPNSQAYANLFSIPIDRLREDVEDDG